VTHNTFLLQEDNSLKCNLNRFGSGTSGAILHDSKATSFEEHLHTIQQKDVRFMVSISSKREPNELEPSHLSAERRLHTIELRLE
jgi:hypothetical protein